MRCFSLLFALVLVEPCIGWQSVSPTHAVACRAAATAKCASGGGMPSLPGHVFTRRGAVLAGAGIALLPLLPKEAAADMTLNSFKRSYFRWVPRIEAGIGACKL